MIQKIASKIIYLGQHLTPVLEDGPKLGTKERRKWLYWQQAYVQLPNKILERFPVKKVSKEVKKILRTQERTNKISVAVSECDSNYERIEVKLPTGFWCVHLRVLQQYLNKTHFRIGYLMEYGTHLEMMLIREASFSRRAK